MTAEHPEQPGRVPVGELRAFIEERRDSYEHMAFEKQDLLDDLEAVIERYE